MLSRACHFVPKSHTGRGSQGGINFPWCPMCSVLGRSYASLPQTLSRSDVP